MIATGTEKGAIDVTGAAIEMDRSATGTAIVATVTAIATTDLTKPPPTIGKATKKLPKILKSFKKPSDNGI